MQRKSSLVYELKSQRTFWITAFASLSIAVVGGVLLFASDIDGLWGAKPYSAWRSLARDFGSLLLVSVALSLVWELTGKRSFVDEIYSKFGVAHSVQLSGLEEIVFRPEDINWEELFRSAYEVDLFFAYNSQWRTTHEVRLRQLVSRKGVRVRLILPNIEDSVTVADLARRFAKTRERLKAKVQGAREQFEELAHIARESGAQVEIYLYDLSLHYSLYRFDDVYIFALYTQRTEKAYVPHFICREGGALAKFFNDEIGGLVSGRYSKRVL